MMRPFPRIPHDACRGRRAAALAAVLLVVLVQSGCATYTTKF